MKAIQRVAMGLALAAALAAPQALAQQERPLMLHAGQSFAWDSNVFRLPDAADPQLRLGSAQKSDYWSASSLGVRVDQPYRQQRFLMDATLTANRYQEFSYLDFDAVQYRAAWNWQLTPRLGGVLSADRSESLVNYADFRLASQRNVRTSESRRFSVDTRLFGGWSLLAAFTRRESENSVTFLQERSFESDGVESGIRYLARSGSSVTAHVRRFDGKYTEQPLDAANLVDDGFVRQESDLAVSWILTGRSTLTGRLAWIDYQSDHFAQRDFSGDAASLAWHWQASGKLSVNVAASRDLSASSDVFSTIRTQRLSVGPAWELGARTVLRMSLEHAESDYLDPVVPGPSREDRLRSASLALDWRAWRNLTVTASLQNQRRSSTDPSFAFHGTAATLGASLLF